jgi:hypothetical protein
MHIGSRLQRRPLAGEAYAEKTGANIYNTTGGPLDPHPRLGSRSRISTSSAVLSTATGTRPLYRHTATCTENATKVAGNIQQ